ncbi:secreted salivary gland peptide, putative, partial [Ixodes scapularis]
MKGCVLFFAGVALLGLLFSRAEARCPSNEGIVSDCSASSCSADECAAKGLECCPKPCGGTWCVKGEA